MTLYFVTFLLLQEFVILLPNQQQDKKPQQGDTVMQNDSVVVGQEVMGCRECDMTGTEYYHAHAPRPSSCLSIHVTTMKQNLLSSSEPF